MEFGFSDYYIIGEFIACWGSLLICVTTLLSYALYDKRQRLFLIAAASTFFASFFNILSVRCISNFSVEHTALSTFVTTLYFLVLLISPYVMSYYVCDIAFQKISRKKIFFSIGGILQAFYMLLVLINIKTGWIFYYDPNNGYTRGLLKNFTYILTAIYGLSIIIIVLIQRKFLARRILWVFILYPFISFCFVVIQFFYPKVVLTGVASFTSVLFAYLTIQSYSMEINFATGLMNESRL